MNIYDWAKNVNYAADYYDQTTGYIYKVQEYGDRLKKGNNINGIKVVDTFGNLIGYARK